VTREKIEREIITEIRAAREPEEAAREVRAWLAARQDQSGTQNTKYRKKTTKGNKFQLTNEKK